MVSSSLQPSPSLPSSPPSSEAVAKATLHYSDLEDENTTRTNPQNEAPQKSSKDHDFILNNCFVNSIIVGITLTKNTIINSHTSSPTPVNAVHTDERKYVRTYVICTYVATNSTFKAHVDNDTSNKQ